MRNFNFIKKLCLKVNIKFSDTKLWVLNIIKSEHFIQTGSVFQIKRKNRKQNSFSKFLHWSEVIKAASSGFFYFN